MSTCEAHKTLEGLQESKMRCWKKGEISRGHCGGRDLVFYGFPMVFVWIFPIFLWFSYDFPWIFPFSPGFSLAFPQPTLASPAGPRRRQQDLEARPALPAAPGSSLGPAPRAAGGAARAVEGGARRSDKILGEIVWIMSGWWFGTWLLFFHILGMSSSQVTNSYFSEGFKPPTRCGFRWI